MLYGPNGLEPFVTVMASKHVLATPAKQPENGPPLASVLAEANSVKMKWPPLLWS